MATLFEPRESVQERPLEQWGSIAAELAGAEIGIVRGRRWEHRVISAGRSGPPLLMYHGIGGHAETYARNIQALSRHFRVHAVDAVFHGFSSKEGFELATMYDLLAEGFIDLIDALGYSSVFFEGESMGAQFGATAALRFPERIDRMVINAGFYLNKPDRDGFAPAARSAANLGELSAKAVTDPSFDNVRNRLRWLVSDPTRVTEDMVSVRSRIYSRPEINDSMRKIFNLDHGAFGPHLYDVDYDLAQLRTWKPETLVLWGEHNPGHGPDYGAYWAETIGAAFYEFRDAGHWPHWEKPDEYNAVVTQFLTH
ncbi:alpha/beta fold hydrolase [Nocardia fluminea]|uniref:alpha/beta fold hydrolase n=1 Tax=Nocardia fluminea TaxID=134984 RepID=UPI00340569DA